MRNITKTFEQEYLPVKALLFYDQRNSEDIYIESYDIAPNGSPINAHPLGTREMQRLAERFKHVGQLSTNYLFPKGMMPENVLSVSPNGSVVWYTPAQAVQLYFIEKLGIPCGMAKVPPLVWKADRQSLYLFALNNSKRPEAATPLCYAPFFNIYDDGKICMGTVDVEIDPSTCLQDFIGTWQEYFWNSYFSHLIGNQSPVKGNIVQLWQRQMETGGNFPLKVLQPTGFTLKNLL